MTKLTRWLFLILALFLLTIPITVSATEGIGRGSASTGSVDDDADSEDGKQASDKNVAGGDAINENRMGYIIWLSGESGTSLNGQVVFITPDGNAPSVPSGRSVQNYLVTRFGQIGNKFVATTPPWATSPLSAGNISNEAVMTAFMKAPHPEADNGALWVCLNILGYTKEQISQFMDSKEEIYLNVQPFITAGVYGSSSTSHSGMVIAGSCIGWAMVAQPNNYLSSYTHGSLNNSHHYDKPWLSLTVPTGDNHS